MSMNFLEDFYAVWRLGVSDGHGNQGKERNDIRYYIFYKCKRNFTEL